MRGASLALCCAVLAPGAWAGGLPSIDDWSAAVASADAVFFAGDDTTVESSLHATIGNGFVATIVPASQSKSFFIGGVFSGGSAADQPSAGGISHRADIPNPLACDLAGEFPLASALSFRTATYYRYSAHAAVGLYAHRSRRSLLVMDVESLGGLAAGSNLTLVSSMNAWNYVAKDHTRDLAVHNVTVVNVAGVGPVTVMVGTTMEAEAPGMPFGDKVTVVVATALPGPGASLDLGLSGSGQRKALLTSVASTVDSADPISAALSELEAAAALSADALWQEHVKDWAGLWEGGIEVATTRRDVAVAVNASLYYLWSSARADYAMGLSPGGLASNSYNGHSFWDCETWMFPALLMLSPDVAKGLLEYRTDRLDAARSKAAGYNPPYSGVMFPWESGSSGVEVCPIDAPTGRLEQHISGDIAFAGRSFVAATGDTAWLAGDGYALASGVADWLVSRVSWTNQSGSSAAHVTFIIPPDEYAVGVDDSIYTNFVSKVALVFATEAAETAGEAADPRWKEVADALLIIKPEAGVIGGATPEFTGYAGQLIKQGDVVLLGFPLGFDYASNGGAPSQRAVDLDFYEAVTDDAGPAMTWGMHAVGHLEINNGAPLGSDDATGIGALLNRSFANVQAPWAIWRETPTGGATNFLTGAGGFLQEMLFGFPGMRLTPSGGPDDDSTAFLPFTSPTLVPGADILRARGLHWRGGTFDVTLDGSGGGAGLFTVRLTSTSKAGQAFTVTDVSSGGEPTRLVTGQSASFNLGVGKAFEVRKA